MATSGDGAAGSPDAAAILVLLTLVPALEEIVFRGGLQGWLEGRELGRHVIASGVDVAVLLTSLGFALTHLLHVPIEIAVWLFVPSVVLGRMRQIYGTLWAPIGLHAWYNGCLLAMSIVVTR